MLTILVVLLVLLMLGAVPAWPYSRGWGYFPSGGLGLVLLVVFKGALDRDRLAERNRLLALADVPPEVLPLRERRNRSRLDPALDALHHGE